MMENFVVEKQRSSSVDVFFKLRNHRDNENKNKMNSYEEKKNIFSLNHRVFSLPQSLWDLDKSIISALFGTVKNWNDRNVFDVTTRREQIRKVSDRRSSSRDSLLHFTYCLAPFTTKLVLLFTRRVRDLV